MKMNKLFYVTVTMVVMLFIATGCQKQQGYEYDNKYFKVSDDFINGYGEKNVSVYVKSKDGLYVVGDATDSSVYEEYGVGLDFASKYNATGVYLPLARKDSKTKACLSYGDIAPVVLDKKKDKLYSKVDYESLTLRPADYVGKAYYADAMKMYNQTYDDFDNVPSCWCYKVSDEEITINALEKASDGGTIYNIQDLEPGYYFLDDTYGILRVR